MLLKRGLGFGWGREIRYVVTHVVVSHNKLAAKAVDVDHLAMRAPMTVWRNVLSTVL